MAFVRTLEPSAAQNELISAFSSKKILIVSSILSCLTFSLIFKKSTRGASVFIVVIRNSYIYIYIYVYITFW